MHGPETVHRKLEQIERLVAEVKLALRDPREDVPPALTLCQESISRLPDWP